MGRDDRPSVVGDPPTGTAGGRDVFLSHVEEDAAVALELADALQAAGFSTWCYERDSIPGPSYLLQTARAVEASQVVLVLISVNSLGSNQVTAEVVRAHEAVKPFLPVLLGISHVEFGARQPEWREAIGSATAIAVPAGGLAALMPRIVEGLKALGVVPGEGPVLQPVPLPVSQAVPPVRPARRLSRRTALGVGGAVAALLAGVVVVTTLGGGGGTPGASGPSSQTTQPTQGGSTSASQVKDAATTPLRTSAGEARLSAVRLATQDCPPSGFPGECITAPSGSRFVVIDYRAWGTGDLVFSQSLSMEAFSSYVAFEGRRAGASRTWALEGSPSGFRVVYISLPATAVGKDLTLLWTDNPPLRVRATS
jgi:hypothetical protein